MNPTPTYPFAERLSEILGILGLGIVHVFCGHEESLGDNEGAQISMWVASGK